MSISGKGRITRKQQKLWMAIVAMKKASDDGSGSNESCGR